jgi:hypothetical protein
MTTLYKYIFFKMYYFGINTLKGHKNPWVFATATATIVFNFTIISLLESIEYFMLPGRINTYGKYQGAASLTIFALALYFVTRNYYYHKILSDVHRFTQQRRRRLKYIAIIYVVFIFASAIYFAHLIRENT